MAVSAIDSSGHRRQTHTDTRTQQTLPFISIDYSKTSKSISGSTTNFSLTEEYVLEIFLQVKQKYEPVSPDMHPGKCLQDFIFLQDGAPPHIDHRIKKLLRQHLTDARVISRHFPTAWPPRSPDITPCDFWLWNFLKDNIYRKRPASLPDLKDSIRRHVLDIPAESLRSAVENMVLSLEHIVEHEGGHIEQF
ncbi:hypothetical protein AVEN_166096-1 [Araneus ventricosus]|uniref:Tc1-like transposase DDE domain-containing protein n=1 Tax=Araneus ventricosus TaxID=182803 RepID=A0A4Y2FPD9_ARAVE|nr:hypothetical protein AVEN_166096-1 [Araneus ventricosus]